ncbi:MAG: flagellar biosynthetic protein FliR [Armatimonadota bacterium]
MTQPSHEALAWLPLFALAFARCAGMVCLAPPLNWRPVPLGLRLAVGAVLAVPLMLSLPPVAPSLAGPLYLALLVREVAVGALLGLGLWLLVTAVASAGHMIDPMTGDGEQPLATFLVILTIVFFVQLDGLPWLVAALRESYNLLPLDARTGSWGNWQSVVYMPGRMFIIMLSLAAPLVLAVILASALMASIQRCLPALQTGQLLSSARHLTTLLALILVAPLLGMFVLGEMNYAAQAASRVLLEAAAR